MAKVRVYELAKEFGVESKAVMAKLQELGEFVRSASSTIGTMRSVAPMSSNCLMITGSPVGGRTST